MIELARDSVQPWDCDRNDHLNMQYYIARASDSLAALGVHIGLGPKALVQRGLMLTETEMHVRFLRELRNGAPYMVTGGIVEANATRLTAFFELTNVATNEPSATFRSTVALKDAATLADVAFEADTLARCKAIPATIPSHGHPRGVVLDPPRTAPSLEEADRMGMASTAQGTVLTTDCDTNDRMVSRAYMAFVFGALGHMFLKAHSASFYQERAARRQGGAALEYRLILRDRPRAGTAVAMRSGMSAIGEKTFSHIHWLFDIESGANVATLEAVSIGLDLETRKAIPVSPEMRERYETMLVEGLTV